MALFYFYSSMNNWQSLKTFFLMFLGQLLVIIGNLIKYINLFKKKYFIGLLLINYFQSGIKNGRYEAIGY